MDIFLDDFHSKLIDRGVCSDMLTDRQLLYDPIFQHCKDLHQEFSLLDYKLYFPLC